MDSHKIIPYWRVEDIRRMNQRMEEVSEEWEVELIKKAKKISVPYDELSELVRKTVKKAVTQKKNNNGFM